jgi:hypothetical protein
VDEKDLPTAKVKDVREDPQFFRLLKRGLIFNRSSASGKQALTDGKYAQTVEISGNTPLVVDDKIQTKNGPIVVELEWK